MAFCAKWGYLHVLLPSYLADSNVKKINFDLRNKASQRITRNGSDVHLNFRRTALGQKGVFVSGAKLWNLIPRWISEIQILLLHSKVICTNTSWSTNNHNMGAIPTLLNKIRTSSFPSHDLWWQRDTNQLGNIINYVKKH